MAFLVGLIALGIAAWVAIDVSLKANDGEWGTKRGLWVVIIGAAIIVGGSAEATARTVLGLVRKNVDHRRAGIVPVG